MELHYKERTEIDKVKWDSCVHYAGNGNIFGYKWFLDHVAKEWDGLVEGDYESVFPLVWRRDGLGRRSLYQPDLMRSMGIYSIHLLSQARLRAFLEAIPDHFRQVDITLNEQNRPPEGLGFEVERLTNHQLLLNQPFEALEASFTSSLRAKIESAESSSLITTTSLKPETVAGFYLEHSRDPHRDRNVHALQRIMYNILHRGWGYAAGAYSRDKELLAVNFYIYSHKKVLSLVPVASPAGKRQGALAFLYVMLLRSHAGRPVVLDFNTREENEMARELGALPNPYYRLKRDRRWLGLF